MPRDYTDAAPSAATTLRTALHHAAHQGRRIRRQDFALFKRLAGDFFEAPPFEDNHIRMKARHGFYVALNSEDAARPALLDADASRGTRTVEIFYGKRPVKNFHYLRDARLRYEWREVTETGAAMLYSQGEDGVVSVFLYPAFTDKMGPAEDAILLERFVDVAPLTGRGSLERHWRAFRAYAEVTSLDGEPTLADKLRVAWMRFTRPLARDGRLNRIEGEGALRSMIGVTALIALGALMLSPAG